MAAANNDRYNTVDILLQYGANPDMQDRVSLSLAKGVLQLVCMFIYKLYGPVTLFRCNFQLWISVASLTSPWCSACVCVCVCVTECMHRRYYRC